MKPEVALIGPGRLGCAIAKRLYEAGYPLAAVISRNQTRAAEACSYIGCSTEVAAVQLKKTTTAQIILLAVPDDQIQKVAKQIRSETHFTNPMTMIHFSGCHPAQIMGSNTPLLSLLSLHPLLPFADRQTAYMNLQQCPCALESESPQTLLLGEVLVDAIGGQPFKLDPDKKPLYHTAACVASNYLVTLLASARDLLVTCGIAEDQAIPLLLPLVQASLNNVRDFGPEQGLTGPIVRGDSGTVSNQIKSLKNGAPELLQLYLHLGLATVKNSHKSGRLNSKAALEMQALLTAEIEALNDD